MLVGNSLSLAEFVVIAVDDGWIEFDLVAGKERFEALAPSLQEKVLAQLGLLRSPLERGSVGQAICIKHDVTSFSKLCPCSVQIASAWLATISHYSTFSPPGFARTDASGRSGKNNPAPDTTTLLLQMRIYR